MFQTKLYGKILLAVLVLAVGLGAFPMMPVQASGLSDEGTPPDNSRLETIWARQLKAYARADAMLARSDDLIARVRTLISNANQKGWDTSTLQTALDNFGSAVKDARPILNSANGIVTSHKGFDSGGKVTDPARALESIQELGQHLKQARAALNGTGALLRETLRTFREAHRPPSTP